MNNAKKIPHSLLKTWLFMAKSQDPKLAKSKFLAFAQIKKHYGSLSLAQLYLEQVDDKLVEVIII